MIYVSFAEIAVKCYDEFELHYDEVDGPFVFQLPLPFSLFFRLTPSTPTPRPSPSGRGLWWAGGAIVVPVRKVGTC